MCSEAHASTRGCVVSFHVSQSAGDSFGYMVTWWLRLHGFMDVAKPAVISCNILRIVGGRAPNSLLPKFLGPSCNIEAHIYFWTYEFHF